MIQKLYLVEFGEPEKPGWMSSPADYVYVSAETYNQAIGKALKHRENSPSMITAGGSLKLQNANSIRGVKLVSEEIIS